MTLEKRIYTADDMVEQDIKAAPSLDLPPFEIEKCFLPRDGGKMMLFIVNVKKNGDQHLVVRSVVATR